MITWPSSFSCIFYSRPSYDFSYNFLFRSMHPQGTFWVIKPCRYFRYKLLICADRSRTAHSIPLTYCLWHHLLYLDVFFAIKFRRTLFGQLLAILLVRASLYNFSAKTKDQRLALKFVESNQQYLNLDCVNQCINLMRKIWKVPNKLILTKDIWKQLATSLHLCMFKDSYSRLSIENLGKSCCPYNWS